MLREQTQARSTSACTPGASGGNWSATSSNSVSSQAGRREREQFDLLQAGKLLELHAAEQRLKLSTEPPEPYHLAEDGFVFTVAEIETFVDRKYRHNQADDYWYGRNKAA
jgi:hypothetical protein